MPTLAELARRLDAGLGRLGLRAAQRLVLAVATLLAASSVGPRRALDDYVLALIASGRGGPVGLERGSLDLFTFTRGDPAGNHRLMDEGLMLPWWTDPHLKIAFFRPLSALTHWLDERLWPDQAWMMHAQSLAWFAVLLGAALALYRRLEPSAKTAGFAFLLYALDDAHAPALAWLANRNALIATTFGVLAILLHDGWRRGESRAQAVLAGLAFFAALLAGESAVGALAYLVAYAAALDRGSLRARLASVSPYIALLALWRLAWAQGGYGASASGAYVDPLADPLGFLAVLPGKLVVLLHGQFSAPPADLAFLAPPAHQPLLVAIAVLTVGAVLFVLRRVAWRDPTSRFWTLGMLLALVPLAATFPSDRLLLFVGLGAMPLLARAFEALLSALSQPAGRVDARAFLTSGFALVHVVAAPILLPLRAAQMELFAVAHDRGAEGIPREPQVKDQTVVVIAAPTVLFANYVQAARELAGLPRPRHLYVLSSASSPLEVRRTGTASIAIRPRQGFLYTPLERHYRGDPRMPSGALVELGALTARVRESGSDGRPTDVEFTFPAPGAGYRFVTWREGRFVPFTLPEPGRAVTLPEEDFGEILARAFLAWS